MSPFLRDIYFAENYGWGGGGRLGKKEKNTNQGKKKNGEE